DNFIKRSRSFMETEPRIVQRYVGFIAVLSQFCDSHDEFALSTYRPALKLALPDRERTVRGRLYPRCLHSTFFVAVIVYALNYRLLRSCSRILPRFATIKGLTMEIHVYDT